MRVALDRTTDLAPIVALPLTDPVLRRAARDIALLSSGLIASSDAPLLAVAVPSDAGDAGMPILLWNQRLSVCPDRGRAVCTRAVYAPALDALCLAADALFDRLLAWGWSHAGSRRLCVVTDGIGVALVPDRPGGGPGWLIDMAGPGGHVALLPLGRDGVWSLVATAAETASLH